MRAAQLVAPRQWELIETAKPPQPAAGQMLVRMERVAVCGSDKPPFCGVHKRYPQPPGATGHEGMGIVEVCPSGRYREGERVLLWGFDRGLFQEYVLAKDDGNCIRLPSDLPEEKVLMSQLLGTVIHSFHKLGNIIDRDVVVIGQGPVGLLFNAVLRNLGARRIIAIDPLAYRLEVGRQMGATHAICSASQDPVAAVAEITGGAMAGLAVEAVGVAETLGLVPALCRRNAEVICFGVPDKDDVRGFDDGQGIGHAAPRVALGFLDRPQPRPRLPTRARLDRPRAHRRHSDCQPRPSFCRDPAGLCHGLRRSRAAPSPEDRAQIP